MHNNKQAVAIFNRHAVLYEAKYMDISMYAESLDVFCKIIGKPDPSILDIACGPGNISQYVIQRIPNCSLTGIDLAPSMIELAQKNNPGARFEVLDCKDISGLAVKYDAIICGFCIPYLNESETIKLLGDCRNLLAPGGILYLSTMEGNPDQSTLVTGSTGDQLFTHYYSAGFLTETLENSGFKIAHLSRIMTNNPSIYPGINDIVLVGTLNPKAASR